MHFVKREAVYNDSGFGGTIKSRGSGFYYVYRILITLSILFAILMLTVK